MSTSRDQQYITLQEQSDDQSSRLDKNPRTRNIQGYKSLKVLPQKFETSLDQSCESLESIESKATSKRDSVTQTFFNRLRQANNRRFQSNQGRSSILQRQQLNIKSHLVLNQSAFDKRDSKDQGMKIINFNKSNLWSYIDAKHKPRVQNLQTSNNKCLKILRKPLNVSLFLKRSKPEVKVPFAEIDQLGFGHKSDETLSPKLQFYTRLGLKYEVQTQNSNQELKQKSQQTSQQISFGKFEYNVLSYLKDESEDEEAQVDYEVDDHQLQIFQQYEGSQFNSQIYKMALDANQTLMQPQLDQLMANLKQANNWFEKGLSTINEGNISTAIQCFKQALILNKVHFIATFNLAVLYLQKFKISSAKRWFKKTIDLEPKIQESYRGASLSCFKLGLYQQAQEFVEDGIKVLKQKRREENDHEIATYSGSDEIRNDAAQKLLSTIFDFMYLQTLCLRRLGKFEEASNIYRKVRKFYLYSDRQRMINSAFGILLLPLCEDRRQLLNALEITLKYIHMYSIQQDPIFRPLTGTFWDHDQHQWLYKFEHDIVEELRSRSFFKRFSHDDLKPFLSKMEVKQHKFGNHLFPDEQVCIILSGAVEINCHSENPSVSKLIGRFEAGDIIGFKDGDSGITNNVQAWTQCISNVEAIWMRSQDFAKLWRKQQKYERRIFYESLKLQSMFKGFNQLTLHLLAFELLETKTYKYGEVVLSQHKRSMLNLPHLYFNRNQPNAILVSILEQRKVIDAFGKDLSQSTFALLLKEVAKQVRIAITKKNQVLEMQSQVESLNVTNRSYEKSVTSDANSTIANMLAIAKIQKSQRKQSILLTKLQFAREEPNSDNGLFIIDSGRCSIVNSMLGTGRKILFTEISRSSLFGESTQLEVAGLDYLGDIVAGSLISGPRGNVNEPEVVCLYLSEKNFRRVPHHQLQQALQVQLCELEIYRDLAIRKFKCSRSDIITY